MHATPPTSELVAVIKNTPDAEVQEIRRGGVGGSEVAGVLGLTPWDTELHIFNRKTGRTPPKPTTPAMDWGKRLEAVIVGKRAEEAAADGLAVIQPWRIYRSRRYPDAWHSPDAFEIPLGTRLDLDQPVGVLTVNDAKTSNRWKADDWSTDNPKAVGGIPMQYWLQLQQAALVFGADHLAIDVLIGGNDYRRFVVEPDPEVGDMLGEACTQFMAAVREGRPPAPDPTHPTTGDELARMYPGARGARQVLSPAATRALLDMAALQEQAKWVDAQLEERRNIVRAELTDACEAVCPYTGKVLATWSPAKPVDGERTVTIAQVRKEMPDLYRALAEAIGEAPSGERSGRLNVRAKALDALRASGAAITNTTTSAATAA